MRARLNDGKLQIYAKVGTGPGQMVRVMCKHRPPKVDQVFKIRMTEEPYERPIQVRCREILGDLFVLERF
jgi:hypothetical protein